MARPMKTLCLALAVLAAAPAMAQTPPPPPAAAPAQRLTVDKTPISAIIADPQAKAILEREVPSLAAYYDFVGGQTLVEVAPQSRGALTEEKLKLLQAEFDKLK